MNYKRYQVGLFFIFIILGFAITIQFRSTLQQSSKIMMGKNTINELTNQLKAEIEIGDNLTRITRELQDANNKMVNEFAENNENTIINELTRELKLARIKAGLTKVTGEGIIVTLNDADLQMNIKDINPNDYVIHDAHLMLLINELKGSGAQAISVNDERIIDTSEQMCAGPTILINNNRYAVPYVVKAIGPQQELYDKVGNSEIVAILRLTSKRVEIKKENNIEIYSYQMLEQGKSYSNVEVIEVESY